MLWKPKQKQQSGADDINQSTEPAKDENGNQEITTEGMRQKLSDNADIIFEDITINSNNKLKFTIAYVDGLVKSDTINDFILKPLIQEDVLSGARTEQELIDLIVMGTVYHYQRKLRDKLADCFTELLSGSVLLIFDKSKKAVTFEAKGFEKRGITEPTGENVLKGSKEAFIEVLRINTALVRRRIQSPDLKIQEMKIGRRSNTAVAVVFLDGVANLQTMEKVKQRLSGIDIDGITSAGQIETFLRDNIYTPFPQLLYTERPDKFCGNILEGRIGIIIDGLPTAYITPVDINSFLQAPEDYSLIYFQSSVIRILRHVSAFASLVLPAFYVAVTTFHHEMIPTKLAISIISSKQGVPFPTYLEVILMLLAFEVLLEAGLRLPKAVGQAVSIVGAIVIGQAAISADMLSPGVVIVISAAGITGFVMPNQDLSNAVRFFRLVLVLLSIFMGLFSMTLGLIFMLYHLCNMEVFGTPYFSPYVGSDGRGMFADSLIRFPWNKMKNRPGSISPADTQRQGAQETE
jgi:spore germination protein KA